jgi:hypothetical protein
MAPKVSTKRLKVTFNTESELRRYCDQNADGIFVRGQDATGKWRAMAFSELTEEKKRDWVRTWIKRADYGGIGFKPREGVKA